MSRYEQLTFIDNTIEALEEESMFMSFVNDMMELESYKNLVSWNEAALAVLLDNKDNLTRVKVSAIGQIALGRRLPPIFNSNTDDLNSFDDVKRVVVGWGRQLGFVSSHD